MSKKTSPHYYSAVETPIDLGAMSKKAHTGEYDNSDGDSTTGVTALWNGKSLIFLSRQCTASIFHESLPSPLADFRLLISNAKTFNEKTTDYWVQADELQFAVRRLRKEFSSATSHATVAGAVAAKSAGEGERIDSDGSDCEGSGMLRRKRGKGGARKGRRGVARS